MQIHCISWQKYCICQKYNLIFYMWNVMASVNFCFIENQIIYQKSNIYVWIKITFDSQRDTCVPATSNLRKSCSFWAKLTESSSHGKVVYWKKSHHINYQYWPWSSIHNSGFIDLNRISTFASKTESSRFTKSPMMECK